MNRLLILGASLVVAVFFLASPAQAQAATALVVTACGTLPSGTVYVQGQLRYLTQDTTGKACGSGGGGSGDVTGPSSATSGDFASFNGTTGKIIQDSTYSAASFAPNGTGAVVTTSQTPSATDFQHCKSFVMNNSGLSLTVPAAATLQANGGCYLITVLGNTVSLVRTGSDTINGASSNLTLNTNQTVMVTTDGSTALFVGNVSAGASGITVGTTTIASGTNGRVEYNNSGVVGEYAITGTAGSVVMSNGPVTLAGTEGASPLWLFQPAAATTPGSFDANTTIGINCPNGHVAWEVIPNNGGSAKAYGLCDGTASFQGVSAGAAGFSTNGAGTMSSVGFISTGSAPTLSGSCTTGTQHGANTTGDFLATCTAQTVIITFSTTSTTGWYCAANDLTTPADTLKQTGESTSSCTLTGTTAASDKIVFHAFAY